MIKFTYNESKPKTPYHMKLHTHLTICIWFVLAACSSADKTKMPPIGSNVAVDGTPPTDTAFTKQPAGTILNFLKWYRTNVKQIKQIELVRHSTDPDSSSYYIVNAEGSEQYLDALQKSGFVTDNYIAKWREYFRKCNDKLRKSPATEMPVKGLDFDLVMLSKDYEEDLVRIERSTVEWQNVANDVGTITVGLPATSGRLKYKIAKQDGKWLIDDIKDLRSSLDQAQND
jgi:hypothetical protein